MANITKVSITINKPAETVWKELMNPDNLKFWLTGFVSAEHISGEPGKAGSISKLKFLERGKETEVIETAKLVNPNQQYTITMASEQFETDTDIRLISFGNRTEMIQTVQFTPKNLSMKFMMFFFKGAMKKRMENE